MRQGERTRAPQAVPLNDVNDVPFRRTRSTIPPMAEVAISEVILKLAEGHEKHAHALLSLSEAVKNLQGRVEALEKGPRGGKRKNKPPRRRKRK